MIYKKIDTHSAIFCHVSDDVACEYIDWRILKKSPLTQGGFNRAMNQAIACEIYGITANDAILLTIDKTWIGVTPEYIARELESRKEAAMKACLAQSIARVDTRSRPLQQQLSDRSWADGIKLN